MDNRRQRTMDEDSNLHVFQHFYKENKFSRLPACFSERHRPSEITFTLQQKEFAPKVAILVCLYMTWPAYSISSPRNLFACI